MNTYVLSDYSLTREQFENLATEYFGAVMWISPLVASVRFGADRLVEMTSGQIKEDFLRALCCFRIHRGKDN